MEGFLALASNLSGPRSTAPGLYNKVGILLSFLMLRSVLRNFSAVGAAHIIDRVITFFFLIYAARTLGPVYFGHYVLIGTYVLFLTIATTSGVMPVAVREIVRQRDTPQRMLESVLALRLIIGIAAYVLLLGFVTLVPTSRAMLPLAALAGTALVLDAYKDSFAAYHTAFERMSIPSIFYVAICVSSTSLGVLVLHMGYGVLALFATAALVNLVATLVWHLYFSRNFLRYRYRFDVREFKHLLVMIAPMAPLYLAVQINNVLNIIMLSLVKGPVPPARAVGYFGPAQQIARLPVGFLFGLRQVMVPPVADKLNRRQSIDNEFATSLRLVVVFFSFPVLVATSIFARELLLLAFGRSYLEATIPLQLLGAAAALWIAAIMPESFLIAYPEQKMSRFLPGAYVPLITNLTLCLVLIPRYGLAGAAFAILAARALHLAFVIYYCRAVLPIRAVRFVSFLRPLLWLSLSYAASVTAVYYGNGLAVRTLAVALLSILGIAAAGRDQLVEVLRIVRKRQGALRARR